MRSFRHIFALTAFVAGLGLTAHGVSAAPARSVNGSTGADSGDCTASPCKTIQYAISHSLAGDTISIAAGTYSEHLTVGIDLTLTGAGAASTIIDGSDSGTVLTLNGATVMVSGVTIQHGRVNGIDGGPGDSTSYPTPAGAGKPGFGATGGGIFMTGGSLSLSDSTVTSNSAVGGTGGTGGMHSAPCNYAFGTVAFGGLGGTGGDALGGGIYVNGGTLTVSHSTIGANVATGGVGGPGGYAFDHGCTGYGGAGGIGGSAIGADIYAFGGTVTVSDSTLSGGSATAGNGGGGGNGDYWGGGGGAGGGATGGGLNSAGAVVKVMNTTFQSNSAHAGTGGTGYTTFFGGNSGGKGGNGLGGGAEIAGTSATMSGDTFAQNTASGGPPGNGYNGFGAGGTGYGGGLENSAGDSSVTNSTFYLNQAVGNGGGDSKGGGLNASGGSLTLDFDTISGNTSFPETGDGLGIGGGIRNTASSSFKDTIISGNSANAGSDCAGSFTSGGHNIVHDTTSCAIFGGSGDQTGVDPQLSALASNGGLTQTMALLATSPAIDQVPVVDCLTTDQRGNDRPNADDTACDIGAFEFNDPPAPSTTATVVPPPNGAGWNRQNVMVNLVGHPAMLKGGKSGPSVASITYSATGGQFIGQSTVKGSTVSIPITIDGITTLTFFATDTAGTSEPPQHLVIKLDKTKPMITGAPDRPPNSNGWYNALVTFTWTCTDGTPAIFPVGVTASMRLNSLLRTEESELPPPGTGSGVASCSDPTTLSHEGRSEVVVGTVSDVAGNHASTVVRGINIDLTPPISSAAILPAPNGTGWNNTSPTVKLSSTDPPLATGVAGSGVDSITYSATGAQTIASTTVPGTSVSIPIATEGITTVSFFATDKAGNAETPKTVVVKYDHTAPTIAVTGVTDGANYLGYATPMISITDPPPPGSTADTSGITNRSITLDGHPFTSGTPVTGLGFHTLAVTATDVAGNTASQHVTFLLYAFPTSGVFVLGDRTVSDALLAKSPPAVTFFGPQWGMRNALSLGPVPNGFQGFGTPTGKPTCGEAWTSSVSGGPKPPASLPGYMATLVSSKITKSGNTISGDITKLVVVKPNPAVAGTGTIVATIPCK